MKVAALVRQLRQQSLDEIERGSALPAAAMYRFDPADEGLRGSRVQKSRLRQIKTLEYSDFRSREVVRVRETGAHRQIERSEALRLLVPKGQRYGYDLIAHIGVKRALEGWSLEKVREELLNRKPAIAIPYASLYEIEQKFLYYLGCMHRTAAGEIQEYLESHRPVRWLVDGTVEPGSPVYFGVKEAGEGMFLDCWKIATENTEAISGCFAEAAERYGMPDEVYHDLSSAISDACETERFRAPHRVCHFHFVRDVGADLYASPQNALCKRLRQLKLQNHLREQRKTVTANLRRACSGGQDLLLADVLAGRRVRVQWTQSLGWELLMALHEWVLDYPSDGQRQGFPFDPYLLYLHRRIARASKALDSVLQSHSTAKRLPRVIHNMAAKLHGYLQDTTVQESAILYEDAYQIFDRLQQALRVSARGSCPLSESYALETSSTDQVQQSLEALREAFAAEAQQSSQNEKVKLYHIVLDHLDKYWQQLCPQVGMSGKNGKQVRTTNELESHWRWAKRNRRRAHGRSKLTRDFLALPSEYMLVNNLRNERYVQLVLGNISELPAKLAAAGQHSGPFNEWRNQRRTLSPGRLPKKLLRHENYLDDITGLLAINEQTLN